MNTWMGFDALIADLQRQRDANAVRSTVYSRGVAHGLQIAVDWLKFEVHRMTLQAQVTLDAQIDAIKRGGDERP